jgi:hypothetical protein
MAVDCPRSRRAREVIAMYTQEELLNALHEVGADGRPFTLSAVRARLGLGGGDKHELDRFRRRVRSLQKAADSRLERVGNSSYRLRPAVTAGAEPQLQAAEVVEAQLPLSAASANQVAPEPAPQPAPAASQASASRAQGFCTRASALGQLVLGFVSQQVVQREEHVARLRKLARQWKPTAETLYALSLTQLAALQKRMRRRAA